MGCAASVDAAVPCAETRRDACESAASCRAVKHGWQHYRVESDAKERNDFFMQGPDEPAMCDFDLCSAKSGDNGPLSMTTWLGAVPELRSFDETPHETNLPHTPLS